MHGRWVTTDTDVELTLTHILALGNWMIGLCKSEDKSCIFFTGIAFKQFVSVVTTIEFPNCNLSGYQLNNIFCCFSYMMLRIYRVLLLKGKSTMQKSLSRRNPVHRSILDN